MQLIFYFLKKNKYFTFFKEIIKKCNIEDKVNQEIKKRAESTSGPNVPQLAEIEEYTPSDSLKIINYCHFSDMQARFFRSLGFPLANEYSVNKLKKALRGNSGTGFGVFEKFNIRKWFRKEENDQLVNGSYPRQDYFVVRIPPEQIIGGYDHVLGWAGGCLAG